MVVKLSNPVKVVNALVLLIFKSVPTDAMLEIPFKLLISLI
jgi:hypothetical protein